MDIVERREHEGSWWGRASDGTWYRWGTASNGWDGPLAPPWPPTPRPDNAAIVAAAMASSSPGANAATTSVMSAGDPSPPDRSTNRMDAWWNREFPPFSTQRLVFGLVALPVIAALQELLFRVIGWNPSLPRFLFVCVAGGGLLATSWLPGMREMAERLARSSGHRSAWPLRREPTTEPSPAAIERNLGRDFLIALPFAFAIVLVMTLTVAGPGDTFTSTSLLTTAVASLFTAGIVTLRTTVWGLALFSVAGGLLGGLFMVLLSAMTFSDPGGDFLLGWAIGSALLFAYAYPTWRGLRDLEARGFRLPMWIVMGGSVLLVSGAALVFVAER